MLDGVEPVGLRRIDAAIIGAQRCGTTTLASVLAQHPRICLARGKEAHLFDDPNVQRHGVSPEQMQQYFGRARPGQLLLDATPATMFLPGALEALVAHNPSMRVVVVVREPTQRARSQHGHARRHGFERWPFTVGLALERRRLRRDHAPLTPGSSTRERSYRARSTYAPQLRRVMELLPDALVVNFADLVDDPTGVVRRVCRHLGVDPFAAAVALPRLNGRRWRPLPSLAETWLRAALRADTRATEELLGWPDGALSTATKRRSR